MFLKKKYERGIGLGRKRLLSTPRPVSLFVEPGRQAARPRSCRQHRSREEGGREFLAASQSRAIQVSLAVTPGYS